MSLMTSTEMDDLEPVEQARKSIRHILRLISDHPEVGWYLGLGTQSFALLTEALASIDGTTVKDVREKFRPLRAKNPYDGRCESLPETSLVDMDFVKVMERELVANQVKGDWREWKPNRMSCESELRHHFQKLQRAIRFNIPARITEHAADLANVAMKTNEMFGEDGEV